MEESTRKSKELNLLKQQLGNGVGKKDEPNNLGLRIAELEK